MGKQLRKRKLQSGFGDKNHLLAQHPERETATEELKARWRLEGRTEHKEDVYNAITAQYGYYYKGKRVDRFNEAPYYVDLNAHPKRCFPYSVEQHMELPLERLWETRADYEATVIKRVLKYAMDYEATKQVQAPLKYRIYWSASGQADPLKIFKNTSNTAIAGANTKSSNSYKFENDKLIDQENQNFMTGVIADPSVVPDTTRKITMEMTVRPTHTRLSTTHSPEQYQGVYLENGILKMMGLDQFNKATGSRDDDLIGFIFGAKRNASGILTTGYLVLWESHHRVPGGRRVKKLTGFDIAEDSIVDAGSSIRDDEWAINDKTLGTEYPKYEGIYNGLDDFKMNSAINKARLQKFYDEGWGENHMHIYKVIDNKLTYIDGLNSGNKKGWQFNKEHLVKLEVKDGTAKFYTGQPGQGLELQFTVPMADPEGTVGLCNLSQAVEYTNATLVLDEEASGYIPESGWATYEGGESVLATNATAYVQPFADEAFPDLDNLEIKVITAETQGPGQVTVESLTGEIRLKPGTMDEDFSGRIPADGTWFEWDGFEGGTYKKDFIHAANVEEFLMREIQDYLGVVDGLEINSFNSVVENPLAGYVTTNFDFIAVSSNAPDAGKTYYETHYKCGVQIVTPDNRDESSCVTAFTDVTRLYRVEDNAFFNKRPDWDEESFLRDYSLTKPVEPEPDPHIGRTVVEGNENSDCVIYAPEEEQEEEFNECSIDFHFDGVSLCMWSCEFPIDVQVKTFEACVFAYQGKQLFDPFAEFTPNPWTHYKVFPLLSAIKTDLDVFEISGNQEMDEVSLGSHVVITTTEYYEVRFPEDTANTGVLTTEEMKEIQLPSFPEHYVDPIYHKPALAEGHREIHYLLDVWGNKPDVAIRWVTDKTLLDGIYEVNPAVPTWDGLIKYSDWHTNYPTTPAAAVGEVNMPILKVASHYNHEVQGRHFIQIQCLEKETITDWNSGLIKGTVVVNGKEPLRGEQKGKREVRGIRLDDAFFPNDLVVGTLQGPFVEVTPASVKHRIEADKTLTLFSDKKSPHIYYKKWLSDWVYGESVDLRYGNTDTEAKLLFHIERFANTPAVPVQQLHVDRIEIESNNPFVHISSIPLTESSKKQIKVNLNGGEKTKIPVYGSLKRSYPYNWSPMIHSGYYYIEEQEYYLYADRGEQTIERHQEEMLSRPRQGAPILAMNNKGEFLRKTMGFNKDSLEQTHEQQYTFIGTGHSKYYLPQQGVSEVSILVTVNGRMLENDEFMYTSSENSIQFMQVLTEQHTIQITYAINESFYVEMFSALFGELSKPYVEFHHSNLESVLRGGKIYYEKSYETPFYYGEDVKINPLRQNFHTGFLYIDEDTPRVLHTLKVSASHTHVDVNAGEKVLIVAQAYDADSNPIEDIDVKFYENGQELQQVKTDISGQAYLRLSPKEVQGYVTRIEARSGGIIAYTQINNTRPFISKRYHIEMDADRYNAIANRKDQYVKLTIVLRDEAWVQVPDALVSITIRDTKGRKTVHKVSTGSEGVATISLPLFSEVQGEIFVSAEYDMGEELAMNTLYIQVTGE